MSYIKEYASKLTTAQEAVKVVKTGDWIDYGWCTGHPIELDKALAARMDELEDLKIRGGRRFLKWKMQQIIFAGIPGICPVLKEKLLIRALLTILRFVTLNFQDTTVKM